MALIDRIKYNSPSDDAIAWKYQREDIRLGSQLIVNEGQYAVFLKGGKVLDVFGAGTYTLSSGNLPLLNGLINLPFGGETPFSAEVWYVNKTVKRDLKWGTKGAIQVIDPVYNYPVSVRAFGRWGMRVIDARSFIVQIVGTQVSSEYKGYIGSERIEEYFIGEIMQRLSDAIAKVFLEKKISVFQTSACINDLSAFIFSEISNEFIRFGIEIINFNVERISIPDEDQKKFQEILGQRMAIEQISQANIGQAYTTMRTFDALDKVAENNGNGVGQFLGAGLGLGLGIGAGNPIGQEIGKAMSIQPQQQPTNIDDPMVKLQKIKQMVDSGLINQDEYDNKKKQILDSF